MEMLLNEKSLNGQFAGLTEFCDTLPMMSDNLRLLVNKGITLYRHSSLYQCRITDTLTIEDMKNNKGLVEAWERDKVRQWKRLLTMLTNDPPFWDQEDGTNTTFCQWRGEDVSNSALSEAAARNAMLLSFDHTDFRDKEIELDVNGQKQTVLSAVTTRYLGKQLYLKNKLDKIELLENSYHRGRLRSDKLDRSIGSVYELQETELSELMEALERFESARDWHSIEQDQFFCYKQYQPASKKHDWFSGTDYRDKKIDKFRCGKKSKLRCFGYREGDLFYLLRVERDHKISDNG